MVVTWTGWSHHSVWTSFVLWAATAYTLFNVAGIKNDRTVNTAAPLVAGTYVLIFGLVSNLFFRDAARRYDEKEARKQREFEKSIRPIPPRKDRDDEPDDVEKDEATDDEVDEEELDQDRSTHPGHTLFFIPVQFWCLAWWAIAAYQYFGR